jgi:hypothetical protein
VDSFAVKVKHQLTLIYQANNTMNTYPGELALSRSYDAFHSDWLDLIYIKIIHGGILGTIIVIVIVIVIIVRLGQHWWLCMWKVNDERIP